MNDRANTCFVVMPFGKKPGVKRPPGWLPMSRNRVIDFHRIYDRVLLPAIDAIELPEGGRLVAERADEGFYSGIISDEAYRSLEYARVVLADISMVDSDVVHALGVRHRVRASATIVLRQAGASSPIDPDQVRAFPVEYDAVNNGEVAIRLVSRVLAGSLSELQPTSHVQVAVARQHAEGQRHPGLDALLKRAENDVRARDPAAAAARYEQAIRNFDAGPLVRMKLAMIRRDQGAWTAVVRELNAIVAEMPGYVEAHRELGIAENKLSVAAGSPAGMATGEASLLNAIALRPDDFEAHAAIGGELKRSGRLRYAWEAYRRAVRISHAHPYPLLNKIKLGAHIQRALVIDDQSSLQLQGAERMRAAQAGDNPPSDAPWCYFDLAEMRLYAGERSSALGWLYDGVRACTARWQVETCRQSLLLLTDVDGLDGSLRSEMDRLLEIAAERLSV